MSVRVCVRVSVTVRVMMIEMVSLVDERSLNGALRRHRELLHVLLLLLLLQHFQILQMLVYVAVYVAVIMYPHDDLANDLHDGHLGDFLVCFLRHYCYYLHHYLRHYHNHHHLFL